MVIRKKSGFNENESESQKIERPNHPKRKGWRNATVEKEEFALSEKQEAKK